MSDYRYSTKAVFEVFLNSVK